MRRVHILDPQILDHGGHYLGYCAQAVRELSRRGVPTTVYARRTCAIECEGVAPEPVFSHDLFTEVGRDSEVWAMENFYAVNQAFAADLKKIDVARFDADDLLFFPTLHQNQLYAIALWLDRMPAARRPAVAVLLRYLTPEMDYVKTRANHGMLAHFFRYAAQSLIAAQPRTTFCADTREMAAAFQTMLGLPVVELPIAMEPAAVGPLPVRRPAARPTVVYQGHLSRLKGFHLLPEIITRCLQSDARPQFIVQVQNRAPGALTPVVDWLDRQPAADVRVVEGVLSPSAYFDLLAAADIVLLPYALSYYGTCSSGVFAEAAALGKVMVVPEGTVAARQGREYELGVVAACEWTAASLAEAIGVALRDRQILEVRAQATAARFRDEQSVQTFWNRLLAAHATAVAAAA